jgi:hypothetical protein
LERTLRRLGLKPASNAAAEAMLDEYLADLDDDE